MTETITEETVTERTEGERIATLEQGVEGLAQAMVLIAEGFNQLSQQVEALEGDEPDEGVEPEDCYACQAEARIEEAEHEASMREMDARQEGAMAALDSALNVLRDEAYGNALEKGFHDNTPEVSMQGWLADDAMKLALIHAEVSEALEALRDDNLPDEHLYLDLDGDLVYTPVDEDGNLLKPEGVPAELADVIIRVLDYCGARRIDIARAVREKMDYNATRPAMHGKKF